MLYNIKQLQILRGNYTSYSQRTYIEGIFYYAIFPEEGIVNVARCFTPNEFHGCVTRSCRVT